MMYTPVMTLPLDSEIALLLIVVITISSLAVVLSTGVMVAALLQSPN